MQIGMWLLSGVLALSCVANGCGKKKESTKKPKDPIENVQNDPAPVSNNLLALSGTLSLTAGNLTGETRSLLLFQMDGTGRVVGTPSEIAVGSDGKFKVEVERFGSFALRVQKAIRPDGSVDRALIKELFPQHASEIDAMSDAELTKALKEEIAQGGKASRYLLVSYIKSGNRVTEAQSMQFVGLPTDAGNLRMLPAEALKGDTDLGTIEGSGDDATASLSARDGLNLPEGVLEELAGASQTLKVLKNHWMNFERGAAEITPWYGYVSSNFAEVVNRFGAPANLQYMGGGFYKSIRDIGATFGDICPANPSNPSDTSGTPYGATPAKKVEWVPPENITVNDVIYGPGNPFSNQASQYQRTAQYGEVACSPQGLAHMYARAKSEADKSFQLQLGSDFEGAPPAGLWKLEVDDQVVGHWDLASARPFDADGKPVIYIPAFKVTVDAGVAKRVEVKFYYFDKAGDTFREVIDTKGVETLVHSLGVDVSYGGATRESGDLHGELTLVGNGLYAMELAAADHAHFDCSTANTGALCIRSLGMSYHIGPVSYRLELRPQSGN